MLPQLTAIQFERFMTSGRTGPALFGCEDQAGTLVGEYVVKLRGSIGAAGLLNELFAARLADHFGIAAPNPALITIEPALAELIAATERKRAAHVRGSMGLNFGTRYVAGAALWPTEKSIPASMLQSAVDIFAFDSLIQNTDRRFNNPNLFAIGDNFLVFDHETAFSFLLALSTPAAPWDLDGQPYLTNHAFYSGLKSKRIEVTGFTASLRDLSDTLIREIVADLPAEWNNDNVARIERHLRAVRDHAGEFAESVRRFLV